MHKDDILTHILFRVGSIGQPGAHISKDPVSASSLFRLFIIPFGAVGKTTVLFIGIARIDIVEYMPQDPSACLLQGGTRILETAAIRMTLPRHKQRTVRPGRRNRRIGHYADRRRIYKHIFKFRQTAVHQIGKIR